MRRRLVPSGILLIVVPLLVNLACCPLYARPGSPVDGDFPAEPALVSSEETRESPSHGGSGLGLLAALVGTLIGFFLLFWGLAVGLSALLEKLP